MFKGFFIKFGQKEHLLRLRNEGVVYCKPLNSFTDHERAGVAYDPHETTIQLYHHKDAEVKLWPVDSTYEEKGVRMLTPEAILQTKLDTLGHVFCLHFLNFFTVSGHATYQIDPRNERSDHCFLVIEKWHQFLDLLRAAIQAKGYRFKIGFVEYLTISAHQGKKTPFQKDEFYRSESELRIFIENPSDEPVQFSLGSLREFTTLFEGPLEQVHFIPTADKCIRIADYIRIIDD